MSRHHHDPVYLANSKRVRADANALLTRGASIPCVECGRPVVAGMAFDVAHRTAAARGGGHEFANLGIAHRRCNRSDGGRAGAAARHASSRRARRLPKL